MKLEEIILNQNLLKYIARFSSDEQTSAIEVFHCLLIQFASQNYVFGYTGMKYRSMLASLHNNENFGRHQVKIVLQEGPYLK